jgi:uncharacterized protein with von Willebrand factor type A (vWA) domain
VKDESNYDKFDRAFAEFCQSRRFCELSTRNIKVALGRLQKFAREGAPIEQS